MGLFEWVGVIVSSVLTIVILGGFAFIQRRNTLLQEEQNQTHRKFLKEITETAVASVSKDMASLGVRVVELTRSLDKERDFRVENQREISGIQENVKTCFRGLERVENNLKDHVEAHKRR